MVLAAQFLALPVSAQSTTTEISAEPVVAEMVQTSPVDQMGQYERAAVEAVRRDVNPTDVGGEQTTVFQVKQSVGQTPRLLLWRDLYAQILFTFI